MPCYLLTFHGHYTWMPDNPRGYVRRQEGLLPRDAQMAEYYRRFRDDVEVVNFTADIQAALIDTARKAAKFIDAIIHGCGTESTHIHALISWKTRREWESVRRSVRTALSRMLNEQFGTRDWFTDGSSRKRVRTHEHFDYLILEYLPGHSQSWIREEDHIAAEKRDSLRPVSVRERAKRKRRRNKQKE
jgi:REP element-mobilizing transposase RayT